MAAISLAKVSQALQGGVDFGPHKRTKKPYSITQKIEEMFGVTEEVATLPEVDDAGKVLRMTDHCYGKKIDRQAAADLNNIGPEAFGRSILGSAFESSAIDAWHNPYFWSRCSAANKRAVIRGQEMDSTGGTASMYEPINTWGSFTLGLYDMKILEGYTFAERLYERLCPTVPTMIHGTEAQPGQLRRHGEPQAGC